VPPTDEGEFKISVFIFLQILIWISAIYKREAKQKQRLQACFLELKRKWQVSSFLSLQASLKAKECLYQWSVYVKLQRIQKRYAGEWAERDDKRKEVEVLISS